ncbi:ADP-ribosylation factor [Klebsormidium nitens]|uniref:ADP-ribosylation factor n=1 Tax=Klebsormidium nitens TaxID=105231 RepID=A0A1Y1IDC1_KLENI|nr:ADP-ribosylation factor [Klebsormidium nitens]|eukprot:GAQ88964.1 ADP-ribosylation factor [Klebsormidium nitens]
MERPSQVVPTVGFSVEKFVLDGMALTVVDMSGQEKYVKLWESFYKDIQAVVFVVDSADRARLSAAKALLDSVLERPELEHLPLLVFANKADLVHALPAVQVAQVLAVDRPGKRRAWHISASSALTGQGLEEGIKWLRDRLRNR